MRKAVLYIVAMVFFATAFRPCASAQFRSDAFTQSYNDDKASPADTVDKLFSFKNYFNGLAHKDTIQIGTMVGGSALIIGGCQIYNRQYWKLPLIYGGIAAGIAGGIYHNKIGDGKLSAISFATAGLFYWGSLMDGTVCYKSFRNPLPGRATIYSILLPGLGQAYNGEYWKIPIYLGCLAGAGHFLYVNNTNFQKYRRIYIEAQEEGYTGPITAETAQYYRDTFRKYRDYSVIALAGFYLIQIIDANVFAYMHDFNVSDDITMDISPRLIVPEGQICFNEKQPNAYGLGLTFNF